MVEMYEGPRPAIISPITQVNILDCFVYLVLFVMWMIVFIKMKEVTVWAMVQDVEVGINRSATLPFTITQKVLMAMGEVYLGLILDPIPPIIQVCLVYR